MIVVESSQVQLLLLLVVVVVGMTSLVSRWIDSSCCLILITYMGGAGFVSW